MKTINLADYNPTDEEIRHLFGVDDDEGVRGAREILEDFCDNFVDSAKGVIARLLLYRGDREGAYKMAESIESSGPRGQVLRRLGKLEAEARTGLVID